MEALWEKTSDRLRGSLGGACFQTWIAPLRFVSMEGKRVTLAAPNRFFRQWIEERYLDAVRESLSLEAGEKLELALTLQDGKSASNHLKRPSPQQELYDDYSPNRARGPQPPRLERGITLNSRYTFAEFVVGSGNQFAHAAAKAVANQPGEKYNPLFIYGGVGLGKTHLANAIGHHLLSGRERKLRVIYLSAEIFMNELISSLRRDRMAEFKERFRKIDALILDDVQFLAGRERTQEEFFHTFNSLHAERHQIVLTSDKVPRDIPDLEERLRNRFESGLIADIAPPDLETRVAILHKKAAHENITLTPDVALYVAQSVSSNVRELEGSLTRLVALASLRGCTITLDFARQALRDLISEKLVKPDIESIERATADLLHIKLSDLRSKKRTQPIALGRQVAMYLCRKLTECSFPAIGEHFGRDHSTVIHAYNLISKRVSDDPAFRQTIEKIERQLKPRGA
jgi:chromosomal replication initiator protein